MKPLYKAIRLGVIGCGGSVLNVELLTEPGPEGRSELWSAVRGDCGRKAEAGNPVVY